MYVLLIAGSAPRRWGNGRAPLALWVVVPHSDGVNGVRLSPAPKHQGRTTMKYYAGIDVSLESASVCIVDERGLIVREGKVASEPVALIGWLGKPGAKVELVGLEAGPLSQWLHAGLSQAGLRVELLETRHVRAAFKAMSVKTDRTDARGIAQLMRLGWYRPVHCKSVPAQEMRALLVARKLLQEKLHAVEMSLRGILRNFGAKVGHVWTAPWQEHSDVVAVLVGCGHVWTAPWQEH